MKKAVRSVLSVLCFVACCPICFPCYICAFRNRKQRIQQHQVRDIDLWQGPKSPSEVHPLPARRRRLSVSERPHLESDQTTNLQAQAPIFAKLPPELRAQIWEEVVGGYDIYIGIVTQKLRHCKIFGGLGIARGTIDEDEQDRLQLEHKILPLLFTCRRIYSEAVPFLYSTNHFTTSNIDVVLALTSSIRLPRFNSISSLSINWSLPVTHRLASTIGMRACDSKLWDRASNILASMKGLKNLKVVVWGCTIYGTSRDWAGIRELLDMLRRIKRPTKYIVTIDEDEAEEMVEEYNDAPFQLQWGCDDHDAFMY